MPETMDDQRSPVHSADTSAEPRPFQFTLRQLMLWVAIFAVICAWLTWSWNLRQMTRESGRRAYCMNQLKHLGLALKNYHHDHGHFPPAYICDENGKPMHSWRVLILPYMDQQAIYDQYDFSEPWNGPNNSKLAMNLEPYFVADHFQCPSGNLGGKPLTNYVAVVGPQTMWPEDRCIRLTGESGAGLDTIQLIEITNSDIHWMEPRDLTFEQAAAGIQPKSGLGISSEHPDSVVYLDANYKVHTLEHDTDAAELRELLTVDPNDPSLETVDASFESTQQAQD